MMSNIKVIYRGWNWSEFAVQLDEEHNQFGWLLGRHADGRWVTIADLKGIAKEINNMED